MGTIPYEWELKDSRTFDRERQSVLRKVRLFFREVTYVPADDLLQRDHSKGLHSGNTKFRRSIHVSRWRGVNTGERRGTWGALSEAALAEKPVLPALSVENRLSEFANLINGECST